MIGHRHGDPKATFEAAGIGAHTTFVQELDYEKFYKFAAQCDIVLPLTDPADRPDYFPDHFPSEKPNHKKSSGIFPILVAYKLPSVVHKEYGTIYREYFTASYEVYDDTIESKVDALTRMIVKIHNEKKKKEQTVLLNNHALQ